MAPKRRLLSFTFAGTVVGCALVGVLAAAPATGSPVGAGQVIATVAVGADPQDITLSPDGQLAYVSTLEGNTIDVINLETMKVQRSVPSPSAGTVTATDDGAYVAATNEPANSITVFDATTLTQVSTIAVGAYPVALTSIPGTDRVIAVNNGGGSISLIDLTTKAVKEFPVGDHPWGIDLSADGSTAYVVLQGANAVAMFDLDELRVVRTIPVGARPAYVAVSPDGSTIYVSEADGGSVGIFNTATAATVSRVAVGGRPWGLAIAPDGQYVYSGDNESGAVTSISTTNRRTLSTTPTGSHPDFVTTNSDGTLVFVVNSDSNSVSIVRGYSDPAVVAPTVQTSSGVDSGVVSGATSSSGATPTWVPAVGITAGVVGGAGVVVVVIVLALRAGATAAVVAAGTGAGMGMVGGAVGAGVAGSGAVAAATSVGIASTVPAYIPPPPIVPLPSVTIPFVVAVADDTVRPDELGRRAADPATSQQELADLAYAWPQLRPLIAANPSAYAGLLEWLAALGDPAVNAALQARQS